MRTKTVAVGKNQTVLPLMAIFFRPYARRFLSVPLLLRSVWNPMARINNPTRSIERSKFVEGPNQVAIPSAGHSVHTSLNSS